MDECAGRPAGRDRGRERRPGKGRWRWAAGAACAAVVTAAAPRAARAETFFQLDLRVGGYYGTVGKVEGGAMLAGIRLGGLSWFGKDPVAGLVFEGGIEAGPQFSPGKLTGTTCFSGVIGPAFLLSGEPKSPTALSLGWAPRLFLNFAAEEIASPLGAEIMINASLVKFPIWFLRTLDKTTFFGASVAVELMR
jgi:hypothetical protein